MIRVLKVELEKLFRSWLFYVCLGLMAGFALLMLFGYDALFSRLVGRQAAYRTGLMYAYVTLCAAFHPLQTFIAVTLAGASISQEVRAGTLRYSLICPVGRPSYILAKFATAVLAIVVVFVFLWAVVVGLGILVYGPGPVITVPMTPAIEGETARVATILSSDEITRRLILQVPLAVSSALVAASLAFLVSSLSSNPVVAVTIPMGILLMSYILQFSEMLSGLFFKRVLFTRELYVWDRLFASTVDWERVVAGLRFDLVWTTIFLCAALIAFCGRDVRS